MGILEKIEEHFGASGELPFGILFEKERAIISYPQGGETVMLEPVEGVLLSRHRIHCTGFEVSTKGIGEGIKLNYCITGRLEIAMEDGRALYMGPGELSLETSTAWDFSFPCDFYQGVEVFLHQSCFADPPGLFKEAGIDLRAVAARLSTPKVRNWTKEADGATKRLFLELFEPHSFAEDAAACIGIARLLLALAEQGAPTREFGSPILTKRQVRVAKEAERILAGDLSRRRSIESVAAKLGVKPTSLKSYFKGVYGTSVSDYLRTARMDSAAEMLEKGDMPVSEVARAVGFANAGKFSEAFRNAYGSNPLRYRRSAREDEANER